MIGWEFTVSAPTNVAGLAYWDANDDGLGVAHPVGIFDAGTGAVLVSAVVSAGTVDQLLNGYRVVSMSYLLAPGTYVIGGQQTSSVDSALLAGTGFTSVPGISFTEERELQTANFEMPTNSVSGVGIFGPDFTVAGAVPEPATVVSMFIGGALLLTLRRRS